MGESLYGDKWVELLDLTFFLRFDLFFRERGREKEREQNSDLPQTGDLAHDPGMCADGELNW